MFLAGLCILLYPSASSLISGRAQAYRIAAYTQTAEQSGGEERARMLAEAEQFNEDLGKQTFALELYGDMEERYESLLDPVGDGVMGYIDVPCIGVSLPVYHGISDGVLGAGAGHVPGSSLPVGGSGTRSLIAGHTGLTSSKLFTGLDRMREGDEFTITVLDRRLYYRVCDVRTVTPEETGTLRPVEGEDLCTLLTCTPYGINSHRLLVTGRRYEPEADEPARTGESAVDPVRIAAAFVLTLIVLAAALMLPGYYRRNKES